MAEAPVPFQQITVVGAGIMGSGIAQVFAQAGFRVCLIDTLPDQLRKGLEEIARGTARLVEKGQLSAEGRSALLSRITPSESLSEAAQADLLVEAISEQAAAKEELFRSLDRLAPPETILASNTSSLSITRLGAVTQRPDRVIGMHFINPAPVMKLVEVVRGLATSDATHAAILALAKRLGKSPVTVQDAPGFVLNRLLIPMINEAIYLLAEGVSTAEEIDTVMKLGANHPLGPLALADMVGLDTCLAIMETLHRELGDDKYRPCPLLRQMVAAGRLGRKTGRGFYPYG